MKKYEIEYGKLKIQYRAETLEANANKYCMNIYDDGDYLICAMKHFCATHFMYSNAARLNSYDADTRGRTYREYQYQPNGCFKGWIYARVTE